jgi:hypothetical protein
MAFKRIIAFDPAPENEGTFRLEGGWHRDFLTMAWR